MIENMVIHLQVPVRMTADELIKFTITSLKVTFLFKENFDVDLFYTLKLSFKLTSLNEFIMGHHPLINFEKVRVSMRE